MARPRATGRNGQRRSLKMVVTGPYGAGKTTLISSISEIPVLSTERPVTDDDGEAVAKRATTVAMDFGRLSIGDDLALHLYGTPGQRRFDFMWEILADGMLGFVVLVDGATDETIADTKQILSFFTETAQVPYVVAVTKVDEGEDDAVAEARTQLEIPDEVRVVSCDARDRESVKVVIVELLQTVLEEVAGSVPANA